MVQLWASIVGIFCFFKIITKLESCWLFICATVSLGSYLYFFIRQFQRPASLKMHLLVYCSWPLRSQVGGENIHSGQVSKEGCSGAPIRLYDRWPSGPCLVWHSIVQGLRWIRATLLSCRTVGETVETYPWHNSLVPAFIHLFTKDFIDFPLCNQHCTLSSHRFKEVLR